MRSRQSRAAWLGGKKPELSCSRALFWKGGGALGVCILQRWGEKAGAIPGCCPVMGSPPMVASNQCWVCKPPALLSLFSPGDTSTGWSLGVFSCCEPSPRGLSWSHTAVFAPALGKVSMHPALLQHAGKQPWPLRLLLLSCIALPALGQGCPVGCSLPGPSHRQWPCSKGLRSVLVHCACSRHSSLVLCK